MVILRLSKQVDIFCQENTLRKVHNSPLLPPTLTATATFYCIFTLAMGPHFNAPTHLQLIPLLDPFMAWPITHCYPSHHYHFRWLSCSTHCVCSYSSMAATLNVPILSVAGKPVRHHLVWYSYWTGC